MSTPGDRPVSGWAVGFSWFAGAIMVLIGGFHALTGLAVLFDDGFVRDTPDYAYDLDPTGYGWIHLILGIIHLLVKCCSEKVGVLVNLVLHAETLELEKGLKSLQVLTTNVAELR